jgi:hypothetical protein
MSFLTEHSSQIGAEEFRRLQDEGKTSGQHQRSVPPKPAISKSPLNKAVAGLNVESCLLPPSPMVYSSTRPCTLRLERCAPRRHSQSYGYHGSISRVPSRTQKPYPCGAQDAFDVAEYLVDNSPTTYGGPLKFISGESAGSLLSMLAFLHLLETRPAFSFRGAVFVYGLFDWSRSPSCNNFETPLIIKMENVKRLGEAYLGDRTTEERRDPAIHPSPHLSPIYRYPGLQLAALKDLKAEAEKQKPKLPPALFLCGTLDPFIDDTIMMSFKWQVAGGKVRVKLIPGGPHGFQLFPLERFEPAQIGRKALPDLLKVRL